MLLPKRGCLNTRTEMMIMHTCFTLPVMLITRGVVDFVASKLETFRAKAVKPVEQEQKIHVNRLARVESFPLSHCPIKLVKKGVSAYRVIGTSSKAPRLLF